MTRSQGAFRTERAAVLHCPQLRYSSTQNNRSPRAVLESIVLDDASSAQLGVRAGSAGTLLTRRTEDSTGRCVEYARDVYRADRASFEVSELLGAHRLSAV